MLHRVLPDVFGTLECIWAPEKMMRPPGWGHEPDLRLELDGDGRAREGARIRFQIVADVSAAMLLIPAVVVVITRCVGDAVVPINGMKGHRVFRFDGIHREPPVELARRRGIPGVAVRMP